jgi:hypothetical protein
MRAPILVFEGRLRVFASPEAAERALAAGGPRVLDATDAEGRPLRLVEAQAGWLGLFRRRGLRLVAGRSGASERRRLRERLVPVLVQSGESARWAEGAPLGALLQKAAQSFPG